ncbi:MAG: hypothetical protein ACI8RN_001351 [Glaciecola sp.]|jgi:hypothetical protein
MPELTSELALGRFTLRPGKLPENIRTFTLRFYAETAKITPNPQ